MTRKIKYPRWLSVQKIANELEMHHNSVLWWIRQGYLPATRFGEGGYWKVREVDYEVFKRTYLIEKEGS